MRPVRAYARKSLQEPEQERALDCSQSCTAFAEGPKLAGEAQPTEIAAAAGQGFHPYVLRKVARGQEWPALDVLAGSSMPA